MAVIIVTFIKQVITDEEFQAKFVSWVDTENFRWSIELASN